MFTDKWDNRAVQAQRLTRLAEEDVMGARDKAVPESITVRYARHPSGLYCGVSDDLPGLVVMGTDIGEVQEDLILMASELVKERFGTDVTYVWGDHGVPPGFVPIDRMARERLAA